MKFIILTFLLIVCVSAQNGYDKFNTWNNYLTSDTETTDTTPPDSFDTPIATTFTPPNLITFEWNPSEIDSADVDHLTLNFDWIEQSNNDPSSLTIPWSVASVDSDTTVAFDIAYTSGSYFNTGIDDISDTLVFNGRLYNSFGYYSQTLSQSVACSVLVEDALEIDTFYIARDTLWARLGEAEVSNYVANLKNSWLDPNDINFYGDIFRIPNKLGWNYTGIDSLDDSDYFRFIYGPIGIENDYVLWDRWVKYRQSAMETVYGDQFFITSTMTISGNYNGKVVSAGGNLKVVKDTLTWTDETPPIIATKSIIDNPLDSLNAIFIVNAESDASIGLWRVQDTTETNLFGGWVTFENKDTTIAYAITDDSLTTFYIGMKDSLGNFAWDSSDVQFVDYEGNTYDLVKIGDQWWMSENLNTHYYEDGTAIPNVTDGNTWSNLTTDGLCYYDNDSSTYSTTYGALYNWYAVNNIIAYNNYHVPSDDDWKELEMYLGMSQSEADEIGGRGTDEGSKLAGNATLWADDVLENNANFGSTGFTALPGGYRGSNFSTFNDLSYIGYWWSTTEHNSTILTRFLSYDGSVVIRVGYGKGFGFSVRLIRGTETQPPSAPAIVATGVQYDSVNIALTHAGETGAYMGVWRNTSDTTETAFIDWVTLGNLDTTKYLNVSTTDIDTFYVLAKDSLNNLSSANSDTATIETLPECTDYDGNVYTVIQIGNQYWTVENLRTTHYNDGTAIDTAGTNASWIAKTEGAYCWYNNDSTSYADVYGALYNWYAVDSLLAPTGWRVPTDADWDSLEVYIGMCTGSGSGCVDAEGWRGTDEGSKLAGNASLWTDGLLENDANFDSTGFTALPGGYRVNTDGTFGRVTTFGYWWSDTESNSTYAWSRYLNYDNSSVYRYNSSKQRGFSVRLVRDVESGEDTPDAEGTFNFILNTILR